MSEPASDADDRELVESDTDDRETPLPFGPGKMPWWVAAVWVVAMVSLVAYLIVYFYPDLVKWGMP
jgi:hypothetical protein